MLAAASMQATADFGDLLISLLAKQNQWLPSKPGMRLQTIHPGIAARRWELAL
jgi:hypothetical protein